MGATHHTLPLLPSANLPSLCLQLLMCSTTTCFLTLTHYLHPQGLEAELAQPLPPRSAAARHNVRSTETITCKCKGCKQLAAFLASGTAREIRYKGTDKELEHLTFRCFTLR